MTRVHARNPAHQLPCTCTCVAGTRVGIDLWCPSVSPKLAHCLPNEIRVPRMNSEGIGILERRRSTLMSATFINVEWKGSTACPSPIAFTTSTTSTRLGKHFAGVCRNYCESMVGTAQKRTNSFVRNVKRKNTPNWMDLTLAYGFFIKALFINTRRADGNKIYSHFRVFFVRLLPWCSVLFNKKNFPDCYKLKYMIICLVLLLSWTVIKAGIFDALSSICSYVITETINVL